MKTVSPSIDYWYVILRQGKKDTRGEIQKLHEDSVESGFRLCIRCRASSQRDASIEGYWNILKGALPEATYRSCG